MRIITGDETGILKECLPERSFAKKRSHHSSSVESKPQQQQQLVQRFDDHGAVPCRARGLVRMARIDLPKINHNIDMDLAVSFAALRMNGSVELWEPSNMPSSSNEFRRYQRRATLEHVFCKSKNGSTLTTDLKQQQQQQQQHVSTPLGLAALPHQHRLCVCDQAGHVVVLKYEQEPNHDNDTQQHLSIVQHWNAYETTTNSIATHTSTDPAIKDCQSNGSKSLGPMASAMAISKNTASNSTETTFLAMGGREHDVRLFDLEMGKMTWKAKNVPPHPQTLLQQPIWPTSLLFLSSLDQHSSQSAHVLAVGTAYHQVRLYDVRCRSAESNTTTASLQQQQPRRRPFAATPTEGGVLSHRITAMVQTSEHHLVVGDTIGDLHTLDIRTFGKGANFTTTPSSTTKSSGNHNNDHPPTGASAGRYVGPMGSIRQLDYLPEYNRLAVVGLDRMLRIYDTKSRKQLHCMYLKQRLNCVLLTPQPPAKDADDNDDELQNYAAANGDMDQEDQVQDYLNSSEDSDQEAEEEDDDDDELEEGVDEVLDQEDDEGSGSDDAALDDDDAEDDDESSTSDKRQSHQATKRRKR
jgi:WD40 repeat protein